MYDNSSQFYDQLYHFKDYAAASKQLRAHISRLIPHATTLLDVACGTGGHLQHLRHHYRAEGLDINETMLAQARTKCPNVPFHKADMTAFDLGRSFDVVTCLFSAIAYVQTADRLRQTVCNLARHTARGGMVFLEPFFTPDQYWTDRVTLNVADGPQTKIAWMYVSRRQGTLAIQDVHFLVGTPHDIDSFTERHVLGLFTEEEYLAAFAESGLQVTFDSAGLFGRGMYVGLRPRE